MVLSRFNLLLPRLKAPCGASYPRKFLPNLMGNFSLTADSDSIIFCGIASSRSVIGSGNSCHPLNQSDNKPRTKRAWPLVFSRASGSLPALTLKSDWLLVTFPFILIALFSLWYHSIVLRFFQVLSIECRKTETKVITTYYQSEQMLPSLLSSKNRKLEARENTSDWSGIGFCSAFDWLKWRGEFSGPIKEQSKTKLVQFRITFDYQLKSALFYVLEFSAVHVILKKSEEKGYISNWKLLNRENFSSLRQIGHLAIIFERLQKYRKISDFS